MRNFIFLNKFILLTQLIFFMSAINVFAKVNISTLPDNVQKEVLLKFPDLAKEKTPPSEMDKLLKYLASKGEYQDLTITNNNSQYELQFVISKNINQVKLHGVIDFNESDILSLLQIDEGQKFSNHLIEEWRDKLKAFYAEQGYLNMQVDITVSDVTLSVVNIDLQIQEGPPLSIDQIQFISPNSLLKSKLEKLTKKYIHKTLNQNVISEINRIVDDYFRMGRFLRAQLLAPVKKINENKSSVILEFQVQNTEYFTISFEGNYSYPSPRLESALDLSHFKSANPQVAPELVMKLKEFYQLKGYARIEVTAEEKIISPFERIHIDFKLDEGNLVQLQDFEMSGNYSKPIEYYTTIVKNYSGDTVSDGYFNRAQLDNGLKNLILELQNQGYLKAKLISSRYLYNRQRDKVTVSINIDEGPLTVIKDIQFHGNSFYKTEDLLQFLKMESHSSLKLKQLEESILFIIQKYKENGYLEMKFNNEKEIVSYNNDNTEATLRFQIDEGPRVRVASLIFDGNTMTKEYVIRKEIELKEGDILTPDKIEESTKRLQKLGLFNSVDIRTLEENTLIADRTVIIKVSERPPGLFNLGIGVTNERDFTIRGFTGLAYRNIKGTARALYGRVDVNYNIADIKFPELKMTAGYLEPYLFDTRTKGRFNLTRSIQILNFENKTGSDISQMDFILEQNLTSHVLFSYDLWSISRSKDFTIKPGVNFSTQDSIYDEQNIGATGPTIEFDNRDHPFNPTKGILTRLQLEYSNPNLGSDKTIEYLKTLGSFSHYFNVYKQKVIFANSFRIGHLKNLSPLSDGGVPYDKKGFTLGGITTIRGFDAGTSDRIPNDVDLNVTTANPTYFIHAVNTFYLIKSELRFPIYGDLGGALFYDGGQVNVDELKFGYGYRNSAGFAFRYATPVGAVNIEFAWKLDTHKERGEAPYRFHFSMGTF